MNPKQLKYHSLFEQMAQSDPMTEASAKKFLPQFMTLVFPQIGAQTVEMPV